MGFSDYFGMSDNCDTLKPYVDKAISTFESGNIPQLQNEEEDKAAFTKAMNTATTLLTENSLLNNEFRAMGIDFETVLMDEREQAIRRWIR